MFEPDLDIESPNGGEHKKTAKVDRHILSIDLQQSLNDHHRDPGACIADTDLVSRADRTYVGKGIRTHRCYVDKCQQDHHVESGLVIVSAEQDCNNEQEEGAD